MAPLPEITSYLSSHISSLLKRTPSEPPSLSESLQIRARDFISTHNLLRRNLPDPGVGVTPPTSIPNKAVFSIFGIIGVGFVLTGIWFFFWAKNGGFYFKETDWDDYKSTVLRRKGPNGTTLSGATESTDLGGGSVVHGEGRSVWGRKKKDRKRYKDFDENTEYTGSAGASTIASEISELKASVKQQKRFKKENPKKYKKKAPSTVATSEMGTVDEEMDVGVKDTIRAYRHEKPARVGGLNKESEASSWEASTNDNSTAASELLSHREKTPTHTPTKIRKERKDTYTGGTGAIRKVVSTSEGATSWGRAAGSPSSKKALLDAQADEEAEHIRSEARKLQEKGRAAQQQQRSYRDFSFQHGDDISTAASEERSHGRREDRERRHRSPSKKVPGSYVEGSEVGSNVSSEVGTKSYHHPIPGLSGSSVSAATSEYAEEKRRKRNAGGGGGERGYRRGRKDSLE